MALDAPSPAPTSTLVENYHLDLWASPPTYLCLLCPYRNASPISVQTHIATEHGVEVVPSPLLVHLAPILTPEAAVAHEVPTDEDPSTPQEVSHE